MTSSPVICFGQQPCGFFPRRYLFAKMQAARRLQAQIGGEIVFFYHDSDHDPRETKTILRNRKSNKPLELNFVFENKLQRKYSPLYLKRVSREWQERTALQLPGFVDARWIEAFRSVAAESVACFCLELYRAIGLLEGMKIVRSSDPELRGQACAIPDFFVDVPYSGEIVRARWKEGALQLHAGGDAFLTLPSAQFTKAQISPARDTRLRWMQSIVGCTHYVCGASEQAYLRQEEAPEIHFVNRDEIDRSHEAYH